MIKGFKCKHTRKVFERGPTRRWTPEIVRQAHRKLLMLHAACLLDELKVPPGNRLEKLRGSLRGRYSIRINDQLRICFRWHNRDAYEVEIVDYHQ